MKIVNFIARHPLTICAINVAAGSTVLMLAWLSRVVS